MTPPESATGGHVVPLPGSPWHVWRDALLRSAGFPVAGLDRFAAPALAAAVDRGLAGQAAEGEEERAFAAAAHQLGHSVHAVAADPRFRCAVLWQNPGALPTIEGILRDGPLARRDERRRRREDTVAKYWQRYCAKNDTAGFFGPYCWTTVEESGPALAGRPGGTSPRRQFAFLEWWALVALAERIAADPRVRPWLPVALQPPLSVRDRRLLLPYRPARPLAAAAAALLARCDGRRRVSDLATELGTGPAAPFRRPEDVVAQIEELAGQGVLRVGFALPVDLSAEPALREQLRRIEDREARRWAVGTLDRLCAHRDAAAAATAPAEPPAPAELAAAVAALETTFTELTGRPPRHRPGETYAGRTLCHLDATRDLDLRFGPALLAKLAPLAPLLRSARWLTATVAGAYREAIAGLYEELAADLGRPDVPLDELWYLAHGMIFGRNRPADELVAEFDRRWTSVLGLADPSLAGRRELRYAGSELDARAAEAFPASAPGWWYARMHGADVHVCAPDWQSVARGDFTVVLGELHIGLAPFNTDFFRLGHPDPGALAAALRADLPGSRVELLLHEDWPRNCARNARWIHGPDDVQLAFAPAGGADPDRLVPITALQVTGSAAGPVVRAGDGRSWPVAEVFAELLGVHTFDTWKLAGRAGHRPRIVVDELVLARETWRTTVGETGLAGLRGELERYRGVRRWRRELGLPERVFVLVGTETKPCYVDLTSLVYARLLCTMLRSARARSGDAVQVVVTELLPAADQAWLTDDAGNRYASELRLHIRDPRSPDQHGAGPDGAR